MIVRLDSTEVSEFTCRGKFMFNPATSFDNWDAKQEEKNFLDSLVTNDNNTS